MKTRKEFEDTFGASGSYKQPLDRIETLFRTYLPNTLNTVIQSVNGVEEVEQVVNLANGSQTIVKKIIFKSDKDRDDLLDILRQRVKQLEAQKVLSPLRNTVAGISFDRIQHSIERIIQYIQETQHTKRDICEEDRARIAKKQVELNAIYDKIIAFATALSAQKSKKSAEIDCDWAAIMAKLPEMTIGEIVEKYAALEGKTAMVGGGKYKPVNYFEPQHDMDDKAYEDIKHRIESLLVILQMKQYLDKTSKGSKGPKQTSITKTVDKKVSKSMMPLFDYFRTAFDPLYGFLESCLLDFSVPNEALVSSLLTLMTCCEAIQVHGEGIYRLTGVDPIVYDFICKQLDCMDKGSDDKKEKMIGHIEDLPPIKVQTDIKKSPIRFFVVDKNLMMPFKRKRSKTLYDATTAFFQKGDLFLVKGATNSVTNSVMHLPMNTYDIDFSTSHIVEHPFMKKGEFFFDEVVALKETILYTDSELALSIFIAFKDMLPVGK